MNIFRAARSGHADGSPGTDAELPTLASHHASRDLEAGAATPSGRRPKGRPASLSKGKLLVAGLAATGPIGLGLSIRNAASGRPSTRPPDPGPTLSPPSPVPTLSPPGWTPPFFPFQVEQGAAFLKSAVSSNDPVRVLASAALVQSGIQQSQGGYAHTSSAVDTVLQTVAMGIKTTEMGPYVQSMLSQATKSDGLFVPVANETFVSAHPPLNGTSPNGTTGAVVRQESEGDCTSLATLHAFAVTPTGRRILDDTVRGTGNGSYVVRLRGEPNATVHFVPPDVLNLKPFDKGDGFTKAVLVVLNAHFSANNGSGIGKGLPLGAVSPVLAGNMAVSQSVDSTGASSKQLQSYLYEIAPRVGIDIGMLVSGNPDKNADWGPGCDHAFTIHGINRTSGSVEYSNPWDSSVRRHTAIEPMAAQAVGSCTEFNTIGFAPAHPPAVIGGMALPEPATG